MPGLTSGPALAQSVPQGANAHCRPTGVAVGCVEQENKQFNSLSDALQWKRDSAGSVGAFASSATASLPVQDTPEARECFDVAHDKLVPAPNRFLSCTIGGGNQHATLWVEGTPEPAGDISFVVWEYVKFLPNSNSWEHHVWFDFVKSTGVFAEYSVNVRSYCSAGRLSPGTRACTTPSLNVIQAPGASLPGERFYGMATETEIAPAVMPHVQDVSASLGVETVVYVPPNFLPNPSVTPRQPLPGGAYLTGRCNSRKVGTGFNLGCINPAKVPAITFDGTTDPTLLGPVTKHMYDAQKKLVDHWGVPQFNNPMTRTTDEAIKRLNTSTACPSTLPRPEGIECDEFPFQSVLEGAGMWGTGPGQQDVHWSREMIDGKSNQAGGKILQIGYDANRIIDGDKFWVKTIKADGSASW